MNRMDEPDRPDDERPWEGEADELERASENVFEGWPADDAPGEAAAVDEPFDTVVESPPFEPVSTEEVAEPVATEEVPEPASLVDDEPPRRGGARPGAPGPRGASDGNELRARAGRPHDPPGVSGAGG